MTIHAEKMYIIEHDSRTIGARTLSQFALESLIDSDSPEAVRAIHVARGVAKDDFGLFVSSIHASGVTTESFLVQRYIGDGRGIIVPSDYVLESPGFHLSIDIARNIKAVDPGEISQFGLDDLIPAAARQYPGI